MYLLPSVSNIPKMNKRSNVPPMLNVLDILIVLDMLNIAVFQVAGLVLVNLGGLTSPHKAFSIQ